jgi:hypothetical protein
MAIKLLSEAVNTQTGHVNSLSERGANADVIQDNRSYFVCMVTVIGDAYLRTRTIIFIRYNGA